MVNSGTADTPMLLTVRGDGSLDQVAVGERRLYLSVSVAGTTTVTIDTATGVLRSSATGGAGGQVRSWSLLPVLRAGENMLVVYGRGSVTLDVTYTPRYVSIEAADG